MKKYLIQTLLILNIFSYPVLNATLDELIHAINKKDDDRACEILATSDFDLHIETRNPLLCDAVANDMLKTVKALLNKGPKKGVDINLGNLSGVTPLHFAVSYSKNIEIFKLLISRGADVNAKDLQGVPVLHYAASSTLKDLAVTYVNILLENPKTNIHVKDRRLSIIDQGAEERYGGNNVLHAAGNNCYGANLGVVKSILNNKDIDVNELDNAGNTPLHCVILKGYNIELLKVLLSCPRINVFKENSKGQTALDLIKEEFEGHFRKLNEEDCGAGTKYELESIVIPNRKKIGQLLIKRLGLLGPQMLISKTGIKDMQVGVIIPEEIIEHIATSLLSLEEEEQQESN